jgi:hypothetical protein
MIGPQAFSSAAAAMAMAKQEIRRVRQFVSLLPHLNLYVPSVCDECSTGREIGLHQDNWLQSFFGCCGYSFLLYYIK